ncbi:hypothetical protein CJ738_33780, partial [Klebsiella pneumoniae]
GGSTGRFSDIPGLGKASATSSRWPPGMTRAGAVKTRPYRLHHLYLRLTAAERGDGSARTAIVNRSLWMQDRYPLRRINWPLQRYSGARESLCYQQPLAAGDDARWR